MATHAGARAATLILLATVLTWSVVENSAWAQPAGDNTPADTKPADPPADAKPADAKPGDTPAPGTTPGATPADGAPVAAEPAAPEVPINLRLRSLEQRVQALKERAWRAKARVGQLKEAVLGGGVGARASVKHINKMGSKFRLLKLVYALDGSQIFARSDDSGKLHDEKDFDVLTGPIAPGSHTLSVVAVYRGNGYGVFRYLNKYRFTVRSSHTFTVDEGKATSIRAVAFEKGNATTPMEKRPGIDFKVSVIRGGTGKVKNSGKK